MKRLARVLWSGFDPTAHAVQRIAREIQFLAGADPVAKALQTTYDKVMTEPVPPSIAGLLNRLPLEGPRSYRPTAQQSRVKHDRRH